MREIKFRAYAVEGLIGSQWIENGYGITKIEYTNGTRSVHILTPYGDYQVVEESVGQYTGLNDINGKEIYEGDILRLNVTDELIESSFNNSNLGKKVLEKKATNVTVVFKNDKKILGIFFDLYFEIEGKLISLGSDRGHLFPMYVVEKGGEVIGNIYENPELL